MLLSQSSRSAVLNLVPRFEDEPCITTLTDVGGVAPAEDLGQDRAETLVAALHRSRW